LRVSGLLACVFFLSGKNERIRRKNQEKILDIEHELYGVRFSFR